MKKILLLCVMVIMSFLLVGCGSEDDERGISLVIIAGRHAHADSFTQFASNQEVQDLVSQAFTRGRRNGQYYAEGQIAFIISDGNPSLRSFPVPLVIENNSASRRNDSIDDLARDLLVFALAREDVRATSPEADLLSAIALAQSHLDANPGRENHILIFDSGISTRGFDMNAINIREGTPSDVVAQIQMDIPNLANTYISFYGLGNTSYPQRNLAGDTSFGIQLAGIWTEIFTRSGAELTEPIRFTPQGEVRPENTRTGYPRVTEVAFRRAGAPPSEQGASLVIIAGRHSNARLFTQAVSNQNVQNLISQAFSVGWNHDSQRYYAQAQIAVIVSDGTPSLRRLPQDLLYYEFDSVALRNQGISRMTADIASFLISPDLRATVPEVDLLGAVAEAQRHLRANPGRESHILILGTGLSTTGMFDMTRINIQDGSPGEVVSRIPTGGIPSLEGINVSFFGMGNVAHPQRDLRNDTIFTRQLEGIWNEVFAASGATLHHPIFFGTQDGEPMRWFEDDPDGRQDGYPRVSPIILRPNLPDDEWRPGEISVGTFRTFDSAELGFIPDTSRFLDPNQARRVIYDTVRFPRYGNPSIEQFLRYNPTQRIFVVGSIARVRPESSQINDSLSTGRARAVANILIELGIPADRIVVVGAGTTRFSWNDGDEFPGGTFPANSAAQQNNRIVTIVPEGSALGPTQYFNELTGVPNLLLINP